MIFSLSACGLELHISFGVAAVETYEDEATDPGDACSFPISFVGRHDQVEMIPFDQRTPAWDDE